MALGANWANISKMVVGQGLRLAGIGLAIGLAIALVITRLIGGLLFGVSPSDPLTYSVIIVALGAIAILACLVPARRAVKVDPLIALKQD